MIHHKKAGHMIFWENIFFFQIVVPLNFGKVKSTKSFLKMTLYINALYMTYLKPYV